MSEKTMGFVMAPEQRKEKIKEFLETEIESKEDLEKAIDDLNSSEL